MTQNNQPIRILFAEDLPADAEMARFEIKNGGIEFIYKLVETEYDFRQELTTFTPDIVISDYSMPSFDGMTALEIAKEFSPLTPFIMLTGSMNEETAVACMKAGANDYVIKEQIKRLPFAVKEAIEKSQDRKEKVLMQEKLQETLKEYRDLINGMNETVWIIHPSGRLLEVNDTAVEVLGYSKDELIGMGLTGIDCYLKKEEIEELVRSIQKDKNQFFHTIHATKDGREIPVEINSSIINYQGQPAILSVARDISDRVLIEDKLRLLSRSVEQSPIGIIITNKNGIIEYVNSAFTRMSGYNSDEVVGNTPRILKSGRYSETFYKDLWDKILLGKEWHMEIINKKKNGDFYWADVSISPVLNSKGEITHFVSVMEEISEKKRMIEELVNAKEKAEESDRLKSAFLANMSHEIRTPLNGILGFTSLITDDDDLPKPLKKQYYDIINRSAESLMHIINDILEISRLDTGQMIIKNKPFNLADTLERLHTIFRKKLHDKDKTNVDLELVVSQKPLFVESDENRLVQIMTNLLDNAIKFTSNGKITFGVHIIEHNRIDFFVSDTGIGIEKEKQSIIFERFSQAHESISNKFGGTGLGLSIVQKIIEIMGGEIRVDSEPGKGSVFSFYILTPSTVVV